LAATIKMAFLNKHSNFKLTHVPGSSIVGLLLAMGTAYGR